MGAPGQQLDLQQRELPAFLEHAVARADRARAGLPGITDEHAVVFFVLFQKALQRVFRLRHPAVDDTQVVFFDLAILELLVEDPQRRGGLGGDDDAGGVAVDPVDQCGREAVLRRRIVFALFVQIALYTRDQRVAVFVLVRVDEQAGFFVQQEDVLVLVHDRQLPRRLQKVVGRGLFVQHVVGEEHADLVALMQTVGCLTALPVDADILFADRFVQQRHRQCAVGLGHELVQPLTGVVFGDGKSDLHGHPPLKK